MDIVKIPLGGYPEDPTRFLDFSRFSAEAGDFLLGYGLYDWRLLKPVEGKKIVQIDFEEPNKFFVKRPRDFVFSDYDDCFDKIYTLCPYTAEWLNQEQGNNKRVAVFFPFNEELIPGVKEKEFEIIYTGHIGSFGVLDDVKQIAKYNYCLVSGSNDSLVTHHDATYIEKLELIAKSKITLCHNLLYARQGPTFRIFKIKNYRKNKAFKFITFTNFILSFFRKNKLFLVPQIKSRTFEAAFGRSLILCKKDPFNVIENFFEPGKEFVYFEEGGLREAIDKILANYDDYKPIIENAYQRAVKEYTTKAFFEKYLKNFS
jgi:hypothetical protein